MHMEAQVAISDATLYYDKLYSYRVPAPLEGHIFVGSLVLVPFGRGQAKPRIGVVVALIEAKSHERPLKELLEAAPPGAALSEELLSIADYLRQATFCTWFEAVKTVIPVGAQYRPVLENGKWTMERRLRSRVERMYARSEHAQGKNQKQKDVLAFLDEGEFAESEILAACGVTQSVLKTLVKNGQAIVRLVEVDLETGEAQPGYEPERLILGEAEAMALNAAQREVAEGLSAKMQEESPRPALLHGVTGSGKTAVFLELVRQVLAKGKTALILVPEIGLTPQMIAQLRAGFGELVAVQHSRLNNTERLAQWQRIRSGGARVVVGTRSAVFAPLENIGLIVVDEEQERSYQSESAPRYDAIEVARRRAARYGALLLLASATPSVVDYHAALQGRYDLFQLRERYGDLPLPEVEMVDMNAELMEGNTGLIGTRLAEGIRETVARGGQVILLLNRRGYHRVGQCRSCGTVVKCGECSVPMVYHRGKAPAEPGETLRRHEFARAEKHATCAQEGLSAIRWSGAASDAAPPEGIDERQPAAQPQAPAQNGPGFFAGLTYHGADPMMDAPATQLPPGGYLLCHYCGKKIPEVPTACPECGGPMRYAGFGTQRIEEELAEKFPAARVLRMDLDTTARKDAHAGMLQAFGSGGYDILLGTQMVAKGLDFERVGLVGVIGIDSLLGAQSYRAYEQVFSLVTQVVGRAGRAGKGGRAMIQTNQPESPVLQMAAMQDYEGFYQDEIRFRKLGLYPPFCALCVAGFVAPTEADAVHAATRFAALLAAAAAEQPNIPLRVLGPAPMNVVMVAGAYRYRLTVKCRGDAPFRALASQVLTAYNKEGLPSKAAVYLDFYSDG